MRGDDVGEVGLPFSAAMTASGGLAVYLLGGRDVAAD